MCQQLTAVVDDRFCAMKRELSVEYSEAVAAKKAHTDKYQFKSKGNANEQQYEHQVAVLGTSELKQQTFSRRRQRHLTVKTGPRTAFSREKQILKQKQFKLTVTTNTLCRSEVFVKF